MLVFIMTARRSVRRGGSGSHLLANNLPMAMAFFVLPVPMIFVACSTETNSAELIGRTESDQAKATPSTLGTTPASHLETVPAENVLREKSSSEETALTEARMALAGDDYSACLKTLEGQSDSQEVVSLKILCHNEFGGYERACKAAERHVETIAFAQQYSERYCRGEVRTHDEQIADACPEETPTTDEPITKARRAYLQGDYRGCLGALRGQPETRAVISVRIMCHQGAGQIAAACRVAKQHAASIPNAEQFYSRRCR